MPIVELTSTEIRTRVANGQSIRYRTPRAVEKYIQTHGLYRYRRARCHAARIPSTWRMGGDRSIR